PFFQGMSTEPQGVKNIRGARVLAMLDDSITTDHISPAGSFSPTSPAGRYLIEKGVEKRDFNTYGARRGNHEVMVRGTFGNIRLRNHLTRTRRGTIQSICLMENRRPSTRPLCATSRRVYPCSLSRARSTALVARATGRPKAHCCWAFVQSSPRALNAFTAVTSLAWAFYPCSSSRVRIKNRLA